MTVLDDALAAALARVTLPHLEREWPNKLDHVMGGIGDVQRPSVQHPIFFGCFDWHSAVHGWWRVLRIARLLPHLPEAATARARTDAIMTPGRVAVEIAYLDRPLSTTFERPYGWGWALALHAEAERHDAPWGAILAPWAGRFAERFKRYLPKLTYPIRVGTHYNSGFAMILALGWAEGRDPELAALIRATARRWFAADAGCQAWEPGGDDFLSPALTEALLMARVLDGGDFASWFARFLPDLGAGRPDTLFTPVVVSDRSDGKIAHLDAVNLSRAWCWGSILAVLGEDHPLAQRIRPTIGDHLAAGLPHVSGHYAGEHFLGSFALLALVGDR